MVDHDHLNTLLFWFDLGFAGYLGTCIMACSTRYDVS